MATLDQTFVINVLLQTGAISRRSFSEFAYMGRSQRRNSAAAVYSSLAAVGADYEETDDEYLAAQAVFSQSPKPSKMTIGTRYGQGVISVASVANDTVYSCRVNGNLVSITSDSDATEAEILTALSAAIDAETNISSAVVTTTIEVDSDDLLPFALTELSANLSVAWSSVSTWTAAIAAMRLANDAWYGFAADEGDQAEQEEIAGVIAALPQRQYHFQSPTAAVNTASTTDVMSVIGATLNNRAFGTYRPNDTNQHFALANMAGLLITEPGSKTAKFHQVVGFTHDVIADTSNLDTKRCNYYTELSSGVPSLQEGKMLGGEFWDVIRDTDYVALNLQFDLLSTFVNNPKVPYNARGLALVEQTVRARMSDAFTREIFDPDDTTFTFPTMADTLPADRAARILRGIEINTRAVGAIHYVDGVTMNVGA